MNPDRHPSLDEQMAEALRLQRDHVVASLAVDRRGWTRRQWVDDARRLMGDLHGSVLDLVNGHVVYMLNEIDYLSHQLDTPDSPVAASAGSHQPNAAGEPTAGSRVVDGDGEMWDEMLDEHSKRTGTFKHRGVHGGDGDGDELPLPEIDRLYGLRSIVDPAPTSGEPDWKRIAVRLGQSDSDWRLLSTVEADALRVEVDAIRDREAIAEDSRFERSADAATGLEGR